MSSTAWWLSYGADCGRFKVACSAVIGVLTKVWLQLRSVFGTGHSIWAGWAIADDEAREIAVFVRQANKNSMLNPYVIEQISVIHV